MYICFYSLSPFQPHSRAAEEEQHYRNDWNRSQAMLDEEAKLVFLRVGAKGQITDLSFLVSSWDKSSSKIVGFLIQS
jgi:hypothetical protein